MKTRHKACIAILACSTATGCVWGPFYDDRIPSTTSQVTFNLLATQPEAVLSAHCANHFSGWTQFGTTTSAATPLTLNGENLYPGTLRRVIPADCWDYAFGDPLTYLEFRQAKNGQTYTMQVFTQAGVTCVGEHLGDGEGAITAGYACKRSTPQIRLFAEF